MFSQARAFQRVSPQVVGSLADAQLLRELPVSQVAESCDILEIRLDALVAQGATLDPSLWSRWAEMPILFTARCPSEGGMVADATLADRLSWLEIALPDASAIDLEVTHLEASSAFLTKVFAAKIPLVASFHDFSQTPNLSLLTEKMSLAHQFGATVFKAAAKIIQLEDLTTLAHFQKSQTILPKALMGMGDLAVVSRLLLAQCGSVLNYGYLGNAPTAPGQWHASHMKQAIRNLPILA